MQILIILSWLQLWLPAKFTFSTIVSCTTLRIGPYIYTEKFITQPYGQPFLSSVSSSLCICWSEPTRFRYCWFVRWPFLEFKVFVHCEGSYWGYSPVLHCASLLRIISRVISARALTNGGIFFFFLRLRLAIEVNRHVLENDCGELYIFFSVVLNWD